MNERIIALEGVLNARELGGLPLKDGRRVRPDCLIRSGRLSELTKNDRGILRESWQVTDIIDLRDRQEIAEHPDPDLAGAQYHHLPLFTVKKEGISREDEGLAPADRALRLGESLRGGGAKRLLTQMYPSMVAEQSCVDQLREFFRLLIEHEDGAVVCHCTSGKDRTGLCCALLLWVLGASWDTILEDYTFTNFQVQSYLSDLLGQMRSRGADEAGMAEIRTLETVDASYLEGCMSAIRDHWQSMETFVEDQLGLTKELQALLREKYTVN